VGLTISSSLTSSLVSTLFSNSSSSGSSSSSSGITADLLDSYYAAQDGTSSSSTSTNSTGTTTPATSTKTTSPTGQAAAPTAPWDGGTNMATESQLVQNVMQGQNFINPNAVTSNVNGASPDYTQLFTLYQGLNALEGIATAAQGSNLSANQLAQYQQRFAQGMAQVNSYINSTTYQHVALTEGTLTADLKNTVGAAENDSTYTGQQIVTGASSTPVAGLSGNVQFSMSIQRIGTQQPINVNFNLADMGSTPRSISNVVSYMNSQLSAAGVSTRMAVNMTTGAATTSTVNGATTTISAGVNSFGLQIVGSPTETVTLSAPSTAQSVYVVQTSGNPVLGTATSSSTSSSATSSSTSSSSSTGNQGTDVTAQVMKFQTGTTTSGSAVAAPVSKPNDTYWVNGESEQFQLPTTIADVTPAATSASSTSSSSSSSSSSGSTASLTGTIASAAGPDGSLYVLANVNTTTDGQAIAGNQDVALMKYDSAGNLVYTRTLGAGDTASGMSLAVAADGSVAIAGSVTGALNVGTTTTNIDGSFSTTSSSNLSGTDPSTSDSFVQVFDPTGVPEWTQRFGSTGADQANTVAFGPNDSVIVGGQASGVMPGATVTGSTSGQDAYVAGFSSTGTQTFMQQTGAAAGTTSNASTSQVAVSGSDMYVVSQQNNSTVLSEYDLSSGAPSLVASRNLGGVGGGGVTGISVYNGQVYLGGSTGSNKLLTGTGTVTSAYTGGDNAFALSVSSDLTDTSDDTVAYYGGPTGTGNTADAQVQFANGVAYMSGQTTNTSNSSQNGAYLTSLNVATGQVLSQQTYSGTDGTVTPNSIAVSSGSSSALDALGLPTGTVLQTDSPDIIANSSVRTGDEFDMVNPQTGQKTTITIDAGETMDSLAAKIASASQGQLTVKTSVIAGKNGGPSTEGLAITPSTSSSSIEFLAGPAGQDALAGLGLSAGLVTSQAGVIMNPTSVNYTSTKKPIGLSFDTSLNLDSSTNIASAIANLQVTMSNVQGVYSYLQNGDPQPVKAGTNNSANNTPPAYLTAEIANYQAALQRLTGSS